MHKAFILILSVAILVIADQAAAKEKKTSNAKFHDLSFTHRLDKSSPILMQKSSSNKTGTVSGNSTGRR
jgi:type VI protein secretion system component Hcp